MLQLTSPIPFQEALEFLRSKSLLPTSLSSSDLQKLDADIRARALFSARTANADYLQRIKDLIDELLDPRKSLSEGGPGALNPATVRLKLKEALQELSYNLAPEDRGGLKDLSSDRRIDLIIQMQTDSAWGYGKFARDQDPAALLAAPAQELFRAESRREPRNWPQRWMNAGGQFYDGGRMIALKNDPVWKAISAFNQPYPPFDYGSGMWVRDILRHEAIQIGLLAPDGANPEPVEGLPSFNADLQASVTGLDPDLQRAVLDSMGDMVQFVDGILHLK